MVMAGPFKSMSGDANYLTDLCTLQIRPRNKARFINHKPKWHNRLRHKCNLGKVDGFSFLSFRRTILTKSGQRPVPTGKQEADTEPCGGMPQSSLALNHGWAEHFFRPSPDDP
jgi:hypothetical protein